MRLSAWNPTWRWRKHDVTLQRVYPSPLSGSRLRPRMDAGSRGGWGPPAVRLREFRYREGIIVFDLVQQVVEALAYRAKIGQKSGQPATTFIHGRDYPISSITSGQLKSRLING